MISDQQLIDFIRSEIAQKSKDTEMYITIKIRKDGMIGQYPDVLIKRVANLK